MRFRSSSLLEKPVDDNHPFKKKNLSTKLTFIKKEKKSLRGFGPVFCSLWSNFSVLYLAGRMILNESCLPRAFKSKLTASPEILTGS